MRSRPIGPGVGGLYYSPLLQETNAIKLPAKRPGQLAGPALAGQLHSLWQAIAGISRRAARRLVDARMAEAQRYVELERRRYRIDAPASGRSATVRYY
jgi:hypothetical protein